MAFSLPASAEAPGEEAVTQASSDRSRSAAPIVRDPTGIEMVALPAGTFIMGSPSSEKARSPDEGPRHRVTMSRPILLARTETTVRQFRIYMNECVAKEGDSSGAGRAAGWEGSRGDGGGQSWNNPGFVQDEENPVTCVSWYDAIAYCNWLSGRAGLRPCYRIRADRVSWDTEADGYRLPTEAEWEYACRAGAMTRFYNGDSRADLERAAWYGGNANGRAWPVCRKEPNAWGLCDMLGNVWEWCWDLYGPYSTEPSTDPQGPESGEFHVLRGGSWFDAYYEFEGIVFVRCAFRLKYVGRPDFRDHFIGFRVARTPKTELGERENIE